MTDTEVKAPKIEFPNVDYPVKVISDTGVGNKDKIIDIVKKHATINDERIDERQSSNGKYTTIQLHIVATDQDQLYNINSELRATGFVHNHLPAALAAPLANYEFYFAGPPPMTQALQEMLMVGHRVPFEQIHFDRFF